MIRTLVSIEVDLASSLAIRYACQLGNLINMELHPVYVTGSPSSELTTGVGWVRHTWERETIQHAKEEISELISSELDFCPALEQPRVIYGDREVELAKIMAREGFALYIEGAPYPFNPMTIYKRLHLKFYQRLRSPLIWLRVLRKIERVALPCLDATVTAHLSLTFRRLWAGCPVPLHLIYPGGAGQSAEELYREAVSAKETLEAAGCRVVLEEPYAPAPGGPPMDLLKGYGLIGVALEREIKKESPKLEWLAGVKTPLMLILM